MGSGEDRALNRAPAGFVNLRSFDEGVVVTLQGEIHEGNYYVTDPRVCPVAPPPGQPGIPITWAFPDDNYEHWRLPAIIIRRDDISPAMNRWHPGHTVWRAPAEGAVARSVTVPTGPTTSTEVTGYSKYEVQQQAVPFDITYTISVMARYRGFGNKQEVGSKSVGEWSASPRTQANRLLDHVLRIYQPYSAVFVKDSQGDYRTYEAFMEAVSHLDQVAEVTDRMIGFAVTLRVEAELDLNDPIVRSAVTNGLTIGTKIL